MTDAELLSRARVFNGGAIPTVNGVVFEDDDPCEESALVTVEYRGSTGWTICYGRCCLDKPTGSWVYEAMSSGRTDEFIENTRFPTVGEAFDFLLAWKPIAREAALRLPSHRRYKDFLKEQS